MKKQILKSLILSLLAAAVVVTPAVSRAQDNSASAPAASDSAAKKTMFKGKASAVDTAAMTVTVSDKTINITSDTKITKNGKPATLSDVQVGDAISGSYTKGDDGKMNASSLHDGIKAKKKKKAADDSGSGSTNVPAAN